MGGIFSKEYTLSDKTQKLFEPSLANAGIKNRILQSYGSFEALAIQARQQGNWHAKYLLSLAYKDGVPDMNVEKDLEKQFGWLESSIDDGNVDSLALYELGTLYDIKGTVLCQRKAHELYHKAAKCGVREAELKLAKSYLAGVEGVVDRDVEEAFKWYRRAVDEVQTEDIVPDGDISEYARMMRGTLRKKSDHVKMETLMILYDNYMAGECPEGKPQPLKAIYYLKKAADVGHTESQTKLGQTYLTGVPGVPKDLEKAKRWLEKAAKNGSTEAREVLAKFDHQGAIEAIQIATESDKQDLDNTFQQLIDISEVEMVTGITKHPHLIKDPLIFTESMFTQFPDSPTAQRYLKAFRLAEEGFKKLPDNFNEAVKLLACSYLYENTVIQSFPLFKKQEFRATILPKIFEKLKANGEFYEGLVLLVSLHSVPVESSMVNFESFKIDSKKTMFLKNVIHLIEDNMPAKLQSENSCNLEESYACWLHILYFFLGSFYTICKMYDKGAQAFEKALQCCPSYYQAKVTLAFCLMQLYVSKIDQSDPNPGGQEKTELETYRDTYEQAKLRIDEKSYLRWERTDLRKKAEQLFVEYLHEAPVCDKKYPNCYYHLGCLYMADGKIEKALECKAKGEDAEEKRLPFLEPVNIGSKKILLALDFLPSIVPNKAIPRCSNTECPGTTVKNLRSCPCKQVSYCGRDCQAEDWKKGHKITCSARAKNKTNKKPLTIPLD